MERTQLQDCLVAYDPPDPREVGFARAMLQLLAGPDRCWDRSHFVPGHFTASAFALDPGGSRLVMIHHPKLQRWLQPGGHIESDDVSPIEAAARELREETGLREFRVHPQARGVFDLDVHEIPARGAEPAHLHYDLRFLFVVDDPEPGAPTHEVTRVAWFSLEEAARIGDASVARAATKAQRLLGTAG